MAQLTKTTKVRNEANRQAKAKPKATAQAKAMSAVTNIASKDDDNIVDIKSAVPATNDNALPVIALAASVSLATSKLPANQQQYEPTQAQLDYVTKLMNTDIGPVISDIRKTTAELTWTVACVCVALAARVMQGRNDAMPLVHRFLEALAPINGQGVIRTNAIKSWLEAKAPITWGKDNLGKNAPLFDKDKHRNLAQAFGKNQTKWIGERLATPFWTVKPEAEYAVFDFSKQLAALMKKAEDYSKLSAEDIKTKFTDKEGKVHLNLDGYDTLKKHVIAATKKDDKPEEKPAEEKEKAAA